MTTSRKLQALAQDCGSQPRSSSRAGSRSSSPSPSSRHRAARWRSSGRSAQALAAITQADGRVLTSNAYVTIARLQRRRFRQLALRRVGALLVLDAEQAGGRNGLAPKRS